MGRFDWRNEKLGSSLSKISRSTQVWVGHSGENPGLPRGAVKYNLDIQSTTSWRSQWVQMGMVLGFTLGYVAEIVSLS